MADISDVENALVSICAATLYPNGTSAPSTVGPKCTIHRGWPVPAALDAAVAAGQVLVSVFPRQGMTRNTTRFMREWLELPAVDPTLTVEIEGYSATFAGTCAVGQIAGIGLNNAPYPYLVQASDTPATVAAALAALVPGATAAGAVLTVPALPAFAARVVQGNSALLETRRQDQGFTVTVWCSTPEVRDQVAGLLDAALANLLDANGNSTMFLTLADGSKGWLRYHASYTNDGVQKETVWRRDLCYLVEYPTTLVQAFPAMLFGWLNLNGNYFLDTYAAAATVQDDDSSSLTDQNGIPLNL